MYFDRMISRRQILAGMTGILTSLIGGSALAAAGPTLLPKKVGQTIIWRGKKYTAIKSGKKIVWDKGLVIPTSAPQSLPTGTPTASMPNATPTPTATPTPKPTPTAEATPVPAPTPTLSPGQIVVGASSEVASGSSKIFQLKNSSGRKKGFVVTRSSQGLTSFDDVCTHSGCSVDLGRDRLECNCHGSAFNPISGAVLQGPAGRSLKSYPVTEFGGQIVVTDPTF
jgi:nitrite reductase/ring-hydroxylating ferredoxin subunit